MQQSRKLKCISFDLDSNDDWVNIWAVDSEGNVISAVFDSNSDSFSPSLRWRVIRSIEKFEWLSIGCGGNVWTVSVDGHVYFLSSKAYSDSSYRASSDADDGDFASLTGKEWTQVIFSEISVDPDNKFGYASQKAYTQTT